MPDLREQVTGRAGALDAPAMVEVWDLPLRIFHWTLAASVLIAWLSANILDTVHEIAGYMVIVLIAFESCGAPPARAIHGSRSSVQSLRTVLRHLWQFAHGQRGHYLGLNPAGAAMSYTLLVLLAMSTASGWMQLTERIFGVDWVEKLHAYSSNLVLILAVVHVLGVLLDVRAAQRARRAGHQERARLRGSARGWTNTWVQLLDPIDAEEPLRELHPAAGCRHRQQHQ